MLQKISTKQDLVNIKVTREIRDDLKLLAKKESRSMVKQIEHMTKKGLNNE